MALGTAEFAKALKAADLFDEYKKRRNELEASGSSKKDAWKIARAEFGLKLEAESGSEPHVLETIEKFNKAEQPPAGRERASVTKKQTFADLALAARNKPASERVIVRWVAENIEIPPDRIDPASVPCPAAVGVLSWAQTAGGKSEFYKNVWAKLLPTKSEIESKAKNEHSDRTIDELDNELLRAIRDK